MELIIHMKWHLSHRRKYITPLGEQQWENTNEVQLKLFPRKQLWESNAKENTLSPQHRNTHRLFDCSSLIVFICKWRQMQFLWKENTSGAAFCSALCVWTLKSLVLWILCSITEFRSILCGDLFLQLDLQMPIIRKAKRLITIMCCARCQPSTGCRTHGKDNDPRCTLPYSGTRAGSPEWRHMFPHLSSSCHRSSSRRKARRNQQDSGR